MADGVDDRGVICPRLRFGGVVARGALYGLVVAPVLVVVSLTASRYASHDDRTFFLAAIGMLAGLFSGMGWVVGGFFWLCCGGDIRRMSDWRTVRSESQGVTQAAPVLIRVAAFTAVVGAVCWLAHLLVDVGAGTPWLHGS